MLRSPLRDGSGSPSRFLLIAQSNIDRMNIVHEPERHRFVAKIAGDEAVLDYSERPGAVLVYYHTYTPPQLRGRGIARAVVRFALEFARAQGMTIVPSCSYVARLIDQSPEYADLVARDH